MFSLICVWINDWVNNREAGDLTRYRTHYDVIVMMIYILEKFRFVFKPNFNKVIVTSCVQDTTDSISWQVQDYIAIVLQAIA